MSNSLKSTKIMIIAGEASGDIHGAKLITKIQQQIPNTEFFGIGGTYMRAVGVKTFFDANKIAAVGLIEVFQQLKAIIAAFKLAVTALKNQRPDLLILIDYPGFNLRLAKKAKQLGIKVLYYISPQVWAWKESRVNIIKKNVDQMAVIFPFEVDFYRKHNMNVQFVGHPLVEDIPIANTDKKNDAHPVIGLLPGSRKSEIKVLLPIMLKTAALLQQHKNISFVLPLAHTLTDADIAPYLQQSNVAVKVIHNDTRNAISQCTAVIAASGTVTLEVALMEIPMAVIYKVSPITYQLAKMVAKVNYLCICNIIAGKEIVKELLQHNATPEKIAAEINKILTDADYKNLLKAEMHKLRLELGENKPTTHLGQMVHNILY